MRNMGKWWLKQSLAIQLVVGCAAVISLWFAWATIGIRAAYWLWFGKWLAWRDANGIDANTIASLGQIGDLFGGVNALFAAFAFVGVAIAAYYQQKTFKMQLKQGVQQSFEPLFFKLLDRHSLSGGLMYKGNYTGPEPSVFEVSEIIENIRNELRHMIKSFPEESDREEVLLAIRHAFEPFYITNIIVLAPYYTRLFHLFNLIAFSELTWNDKVRYANIARASLTKDELLLLVLNGVFEIGEKFRPLIEGFSLLRHAPRKESNGKASVESFIAAKFYSPTATMSGSDRDRYWSDRPMERPEWAK